MTANKCLTHTQARVLDIMVKRINVGTLTRSRRPHERAYMTVSLLNTCPVVRPRTSHSIHSLSRSRPPSPPPKPRKSSPSRATEQALGQLLETAASLLHSEAVPDEGAVQRVLSVCEDLARGVVEPPKIPRSLEKTSTSNLLSLDEQSRMPTILSAKKTPSSLPVKSQIADKISTTAYSIMTDPKVFITRGLLATYVSTQCLLGRPESFPHIFDLYASKPIPKPGTRPIMYKDPNLKSVSSAIPLVLAKSALTAAIEAQNLPLCLSVIDASVCATAFKRNKLLRRALLPFSALALTPPAAYTLSDYIAHYQRGMDHQTFTNICFAGILAYVYFTATIGYVAVTTANDQMDRITWIVGLPLRERWLREEERSLVDQVAGAWGFQDRSKRGEEEGEEWEDLREWALMRGMILDKPELMEGME